MYTYTERELRLDGPDRRLTQQHPEAAMSSSAGTRPPNDGIRS